jgi:hypothetical protein
LLLTAAISLIETALERASSMQPCRFAELPISNWISEQAIKEKPAFG